MPRLRDQTDNEAIRLDYEQGVPVKIIQDDYGIKRATLYRIVTPKRLPRKNAKSKSKP